MSFLGGGLGYLGGRVPLDHKSWQYVSCWNAFLFGYKVKVTINEEFLVSNESDEHSLFNFTCRLVLCKDLSMLYV